MPPQNDEDAGHVTRFAFVSVRVMACASLVRIFGVSRESAEPAWPEPLERRSGENLRLAIDAFHLGVSRTRSGILAVTTERLTFVPDDGRPYERAVFVGLEPGCRYWVVELSAIARVVPVAAQRTPWTIFSKRWQPGVWIQLSADPGQRFVGRDRPGQTTAMLRAALTGELGAG